MVILFRAINSSVCVPKNNNKLSFLFLLPSVIQQQPSYTPVPANTRPFPVKSQRAALAKFGLLCKYLYYIPSITYTTVIQNRHIRPTRCRKYITSLQPPLQALLELRSDEALQETIASAMENVSKI